MGGLKCDVSDAGTVKVVILTGSVTLGEGDLKLRALVKDLVSQGNKKILLDMAGVPYMDSTGIGELVAAYTSARNHGAEIKLANLTEKIQDLLGVVQLMSLFETFPSREEAVRAFA